MDRFPNSQPELKLVITFCVLLITLPGCGSFNLFERDSQDDRVEALTDTKDVKGPLEKLMNFGGKTDHEELRRNPDYYQLGQKEFQAAERLFKQKDWDDAEGDLKSIIRKYDDYAVKEDALFLLGEIYYETKRYPEATDTFSRLTKDFPSTRHQRVVSSRMFTIAGIWLDFPDVVTSNDIQLTSNLEKASKMDVPKHKRESWDPTVHVPVLPNFHDSKRPLFDTEGRALEALKSIWLNDPTSELADDALMMTASHYLRNGDSVRADEYFAALRQNYPDSPHFKNAFVLGSHVKLMSYEGSGYDGTRLDEAEQLKESAIRMWPEDDLRGRLTEELEIIEEAKAKREWERVKFYKKKGRPDSAAIYCRELLRLYPETSYANSAKEFLATNQINSPVATSQEQEVASEQDEESSGWNWILFPRLESVPEEEESGKTTLDSFQAPPIDRAQPAPYDDNDAGRVRF